MIFNLFGKKKNGSSPKKLKIALAQVTKILDCFPLPVCVTRLADGTFVYANDLYLQISGLCIKELLNYDSKTIGIWRDEEQRYEFVAELTKSPNQHVRFMRGDIRIGKGGGNFDFYSKIIECDGIKMIINCHVDASREYAHALAHADSERDLTELINAIDEGYFLCDMEGRFRRVNQALCAALDYTKQELLDMKFEQLFPPKIGAMQFRASLVQLIDEGYIESVTHEFQKRDKTSFQAKVRRYLLKKKNGEPYGFWGVASKVGDAKLRITKRGESLVYHDHLTELPNRAWTLERLQRIISRARKSDERLVFFYIDISSFARINAEYGKNVGDSLLKNVAWRIERALRTADSLSRVGSDEFFVILSAQPPEQALISFLRRLMKLFSQPFELGINLANMAFHIGVVLFPDDAPDGESLIAESESAMIHARQTSPDKTSFYFANEKLHQWAKERISLEDILINSLNTNAIYTHYQPIMSVKEGKPAFEAVEAFVRWNHPELGKLLPSKFLGIASDLGIISDIDRKVFENVLNDLDKWLTIGFQKRVAINLSYETLEDVAFPSWAAKQVAKRNIDIRLISFDVNSHLILEDKRMVRQAVARLKDEGFAVNADGFGSEIVMLAELAHLGITEVKIAPKDLKLIANNKYDIKLLSLIDERLRMMNVDMTVSGIETEEDESISLDTGAAHIAGYYYAPPMDAAEITKFVWQAPEGEK
ncbi:MAG: EAL domain-containing protein [Helicobacteraceae bacterium]|jgi:diguanylate cyclase (GGDEF)-like protein/PAS domain S-box-containing protein|nr:EAL domain-containing protein [Helicobacteraceae bacterium]